MSRKRVDVIAQYVDRKFSSESERLRLLEAIQENEDKWAEAPASGEQAAALVDGFRDAHEALAIFAQSTRGVGDLARLTAAIQAFAVRSAGSGSIPLSNGQHP